MEEFITRKTHNRCDNVLSKHGPISIMILRTDTLSTVESTDRDLKFARFVRQINLLLNMPACRDDSAWCESTMLPNVPTGDEADSLVGALYNLGLHHELGIESLLDNTGKERGAVDRATQDEKEERLFEAMLVKEIEESKGQPVMTPNKAVSTYSAGPLARPLVRSPNAEMRGSTTTSVNAVLHGDVSIDAEFMAFDEFFSDNLGDEINIPKSDGDESD